MSNIEMIEQYKQLVITNWNKSSDSIIKVGKILIEAKEEAKKILSDNKIVENLKSEGIKIARRTVAKYRESMRIPSSVQRRRDKSAPS